MSDAARRLVVAIDGPAGAGKSTLARALATTLGYTYVDSGAMYRAVGLAAHERGIDLADHHALAALVDTLDFTLRPDSAGQRVLLEGRDVTDAIRTPDAGERASQVAAIPAVRAALVARQRALGAAGGIVMDGRDIGTVVFPDADCKFFVTASVAERARRRAAELPGTKDDLAAIQRQIETRDQRDTERAHSPLQAAPDAEVVETTGHGVEALVTRLLQRVLERAKA